MVQTSTAMQTQIVRWLRVTVTAKSVEALIPEVPGCERFLRSRGVEAIPEQVVPGIIGLPVIDGLLSDWLKEHRPEEIRNRDAEGEHELRDLLARIGAPVRPYKGPRGRGR